MPSLKVVLCCHNGLVSSTPKRDIGGLGKVHLRRHNGLQWVGTSKSLVFHKNHHQLASQISVEWNIKIRRAHIGGKLKILLDSNGSLRTGGSGGGGGATWAMGKKRHPFPSELRIQITIRQFGPSNTGTPGSAIGLIHRIHNDHDRACNMCFLSTDEKS